MTAYTRDYTTHWTTQWATWLCEYVGRPGINGLEVGCFEGRSSVWFLEHVLQHETSRLTCIDPFPPDLFYVNLRPYWQKVRHLRQYSAAALRRPELDLGSFHFIYVDAAMKAAPVLEDAVLSFPLLASGGIMIIACYRWGAARLHPPLERPGPGADAFVEVHAQEITVLDNSWQLVLQRNV